MKNEKELVEIQKEKKEQITVLQKEVSDLDNQMAQLEKENE